MLFRNIMMVGVVSLLAIALIGGSAVVLFWPELTGDVAAQGGMRSQLDNEQSGLGFIGQGQRQASGSQLNAGDSSSSGGGNGNGNGIGASNNDAYLDVLGTGSGGTGRGCMGQGGPGNGAQNARIAEAVEWEDLTGEVIAVGNEITVKTTTGEFIVGLGQEQYRQDAGFAITLGDTVSVQGYLEDGEFKAGSIENMTTEENLVLRAETGRPLWAGNGRQLNQR